MRIEKTETDGGGDGGGASLRKLSGGGEHVTFPRSDTGFSRKPKKISCAGISQ